MNQITELTGNSLWINLTAVVVVLALLATIAYRIFKMKNDSVSSQLSKAEYKDSIEPSLVFHHSLKAKPKKANGDIDFEIIAHLTNSGNNNVSLAKLVINGEYQDGSGEKSRHLLANHSFFGRNSKLATNYPVLKPGDTVSPTLPITINITLAQRIKFKLVATAHVGNHKHKSISSQFWTEYFC